MPITIFDTNAYRNFATILAKHSNEEQENIIASLKNKELANGYSKELNFWVVCELLSHLADPNDPEYNECAAALKVAFEHCSHMGYVKYSPAIEDEIAEFYENQDIKEKYGKLYRNVVSLAIEFLKNGRSELFEKHIHEVPALVDNFKTQIESGYEVGKKELIAAGELKLLEKKDFKDEDAYKMILISILYNTMEKNPTKVMSEDQLNAFLDQFYYGLALASIVTGKVPGSKKFQNNLIDVAICLRIGKSDDRLLVTNDQGMLRPFRAEGVIPDKAMELNQYFDSLDFNPN